MAAVRRNGGKMFFVIGVKVMRGAEVQNAVSRERAVNGKVQVDVGGGVGTQWFAKVGVAGTSCRCERNCLSAANCRCPSKTNGG